MKWKIKYRHKSGRTKKGHWNSIFRITYNRTTMILREWLYYLIWVDLRCPSLHLHDELEWNPLIDQYHYYHDYCYYDYCGYCYDDDDDDDYDDDYDYDYDYDDLWLLLLLVIILVYYCYCCYYYDYYCYDGYDYDYSCCYLLNLLRLLKLSFMIYHFLVEGFERSRDSTDQQGIKACFWSG